MASVPPNPLVRPEVAPQASPFMPSLGPLAFSLCRSLGQLRIIRCRQHPLHPIEFVAPGKLQSKYSLASTSFILHGSCLGCKDTSRGCTAHNKNQWCRTHPWECISGLVQTKMLFGYTRVFPSLSLMRPNS